MKARVAVALLLTLLLAGCATKANTVVAAGAARFVVNAIDSGTYQVGVDPAYPPTHRVTQGAYSAPRLTITYTVLWVYPDLSAALNRFSSLTPTRVQLTVTASTVGSGTTQLHFYEHAYSALPTVGAPVLTGSGYTPPNTITTGSTVTFDLPPAWAADFKSGNADGVAISGSAPSEFIELLGVDEAPASGTLTFTY